MEDDNSNDVVLIGDEDSLQSSTLSSDTMDYLKQANVDSRPIMTLFQRLLSNDTRSNTILTNAQILAILTKELNIETSSLHDLEIDVYVNIVKKFLKDWPRWDTFDRIINKLRDRGTDEEIKNILEQKNKQLKLYLQSLINIAKPLAQEAVKKAKDLPDQKNNEEDSDIFLEVYCTRKMLNSFIYNQPNPAENNSIFNLLPYEPMKLHPSAPIYTIPSLLNWYGVRLTIELPYFQYTRNASHQLKHVLVNDKNGMRKLKEELDVSVYMKNSKVITNNVLISCVATFLDRLIAHYENSIELDMIKSICNVIKKDLELDSTTVEIPGSYKHCLNKYPYVRKLFSEVEGTTSTTSPHNLYIHEKIIPKQDWHIGKFVDIKSELNMPALQNWLTLECGECKQKFNGAEFLTSLREHFKAYHVYEPDWTCVNCQKSFAMMEITSKGWQHDCQSSIRIGWLGGRDVVVPL